MTTVDPAGPRPAAATGFALETEDARVVVEPEQGGRIASLMVAGHELLVTDREGSLRWGCYPMAPFAGRIRNGRFAFGGRDWSLDRNAPPHAIHGTVADRPWRRVDERAIAIDLGTAWPFRGEVTERFEIGPSHLRVELELRADEPMPATLGWHPWFRWQVDGGSCPDEQCAELEVSAGAMYRRDADGIALDELMAPTPGPWDDCFTNVLRPPIVRWPGAVELQIASTCDDWVIFTESPRGLCVEPQTGPPDAVNIRPVTVEPGEPLRAEMTWTWRRLDGPGERP